MDLTVISVGLLDRIRSKNYFLAGRIWTYSIHVRYIYSSTNVLTQTSILLLNWISNFLWSTHFKVNGLSQSRVHVHKLCQHIKVSLFISETTQNCLKLESKYVTYISCTWDSEIVNEINKWWTLHSPLSRTHRIWQRRRRTQYILLS